MSLVGLGSVSEDVMHKCHSPVLLVRNQAEKQPHTAGAQAVSADVICVRVCVRTLAVCVCECVCLSVCHF